MELLTLLQQHIDPTLLAIGVICIMWLPTILPVPTETSNKFYKFIHHILNNIAANVGKAKNAQVSSKSSESTSKTSKDIMLVLLSFSILTLSGCALKDLKPHEQGIAIAEELTETYFALEEQYSELSEPLQCKLAPMLDKYRESLVLLRDSASLWYKSKETPNDFVNILTNVNNILNDIRTVIAEG